MWQSPPPPLIRVWKRELHSCFLPPPWTFLSNLHLINASLRQYFSPMPAQGQVFQRCGPLAQPHRPQRFSLCSTTVIYWDSLNFWPSVLLDNPFGDRFFRSCPPIFFCDVWEASEFWMMGFVSFPFFDPNNHEYSLFYISYPPFVFFLIFSLPALSFFKGCFLPERALDDFFLASGSNFLLPPGGRRN